MNKLISSVTLIGMGLYGILLFNANKLGLYIHPRFFEESYIANIVAFIIGIISLIYFIYAEKDKLIIQIKQIVNNRILMIAVLLGLSFFINSIFLIVAALVVLMPNKNGIPKEFASALLTLGIISIGLFLPAKGLSSITASQRSIDLNSINLTQDTISAVQNFSKSTTNFSLGDWIAMQNFNPDPEFYVDKEVKVSGFLYKPTNLNLNTETAVVARFIITCCAVDARPVGLRMQLMENSELKPDDWIEVTGKFGLDKNNELIILAENINKISEPTNPYIY